MAVKKIFPDNPLNFMRVSRILDGTALSDFPVITDNVPYIGTPPSIEFTTNWDEAAGADEAFTLTVTSSTSLYNWYVNGVLHTSSSATLNIATDEGVLEGNNSVIKIEGNLSLITSIDFSSKKLIDTIPDLSALTELIGLSLDDNTLTGSIPDLSALIKLTQVKLNDNSLTGSIPSLLTLEALTFFHAHNNSLTGSVPYVPLTAVSSYLKLYNNSLTGWNPVVFGNQFKSIEIGVNAITETEINKALVALYDSGITSGYFDAIGGTNATPTGAGATAKTNLINTRGWTVTTN